MANLLRKADVHVLFRSKFDGRMIWAQHESNTGGTEAMLKQRQSDTYTMEVSERGASQVVLEIDFRKIKSYKMRTRCWHEVRFDGRVIALHFAENETFNDFFDTLELVLKLYKKFTKPKNDTAFLQEVQMFQLKQLKTVANVRMDRSVSVETAENKSSNSRGPMHSGRPQVTNSRSLEIPVSERPARHPDLPRIKKPVAVITKSTNPLATLQKPRKIVLADAAEGTVSRNRPLPQLPPTPKPAPSPPTSPPPRIRGHNQNAQPGAGLGLAPKTPQRRTSDTSDEDSDEYIDQWISSDYIPGAEYASGDEDPEDPIDSRPPKPSTNQESSDQPAVERKPIPQKPKHPERQVSPLPLPPSALRGKQPPAPKAKPDVLAKRRPDTPQRPGPNQPTTPPSTPPLNPPRQTDPEQPPSTIYGMAMEWQCTACTLRNPFSSLNCGACERIRTDAWACIDCSTVYSNDVSLCFTCSVWRCQLCSFINRGPRNTSTLCAACDQQ